MSVTHRLHRLGLAAWEAVDNLNHKLTRWPFRRFGQLRYFVCCRYDAALERVTDDDLAAGRYQTLNDAAAALGWLNAPEETR